MKKVVLALAVLAAVAGSAVAAGQAVAKQGPSCTCSKTYGCLCVDPVGNTM